MGEYDDPGWSPPALESQGERRLHPVVDGLDAPIAVAPYADGLAIAERGGAIRILERRRLRLFANLDVETTGEGGLLNIAAKGPDLFVYSTPSRIESLLERIHPDGTREELLRLSQPNEYHNGGGLAFGPDGRLYLGTGDGGFRGDPSGHARDSESKLGKILQVDVESGEVAVYASGLRNPWRINFDDSGRLWIGDVGEKRREEVNLAPGPGYDFGWSLMEGTLCYVKDCDPLGVAPVIEYGRSMGCSVTGGVVEEGRFLFSDFCSGTVYSVDDSGEVRRETVDGAGNVIVSFARTSAGTLVVDLEGAIYRLEE